jgi:hypothetical protein
MSQVLTPTLQRKKNFLLRKLRELSLPGEILVKVGDKVSANQPVAKAEFPGEMIIMRVAEQLGIDAKEALDLFSVKEGDSVSTGQVICEYKGLFGLFKNTFKSEYSGVVEFINKETGHIGLRLPSHTIQLEAYISGKVISVEEKKSLTIETQCIFVQGIFGVGGEKHGKLKALNVNPDVSISVADIPGELKGSILYGGSAPSSDALKKAAAGGAVGFITGSIDDKALADYLGYDIGIALTGNEKIGMTVIVTEGFGKMGFSSSALNLLKECEGREASINGATQVRAGALRPEIIIPSGDYVPETEKETPAFLSVGSKIRIIREPFFGLHATIKEMPFKPEIIDSGAEVRVLKAEIENGKIVTVPRANVEIL